MSERWLSLLCVTVAASVAPGCSHIVSETTQTEREVQNRTPVTIRSRGEVVVSDVELKEGTVRATVSETEMCQSATDVETAHQKYVVRKSSGVVADVLMGVGSLVGGGALLAVSPSLSAEPGTDPDTGEETSSPRATAMAGGIGMIALSGWPFYKAVKVSKRAGKHPVDMPRMTTERLVDGQPRVCGQTSPPEGALVFRYGTTQAHRVPHSGGDIAVSIPEMASDVCDEPERLEVGASSAKLTIEYAWNEDDARVEVATYDAASCIRRYRIGQLVARVENRLGTADTPSSYARIGGWIREAQKRFVNMDPGDSSDQLRNELKRLDERYQQRVGSQLGDAIDRAVSAIEEGEEGVDRRIETAFTLTEFIPDRRWSTAERILSAQVARQVDREVAGSEQFDTVVAEVPGLGSCIRVLKGEKEEGCPDWMGRSEVAGSLGPLTDLRVEMIAAKRESLAEAAETAVTEASDEARGRLEGRLGEAEQTHGWCRKAQWSEEVVGECEQLKQRLPEARTARVKAVSRQLIERGDRLDQEATPERRSKLFGSLQTAKDIGKWCGMERVSEPVEQACREMETHVDVARVQYVESMTALLKRGVGRLKADLSIENHGKLTGQMRRAKETKSWCRNGDWKGNLAEACDEMDDKYAAVSDFLERKKEEIRERMAAKTAKQWRSKFGKCRRLEKGLEKLREVRGCRSKPECRSALGRMKKDWRELKSFRPDRSVWTAEKRRTVRQECREAGCPKCP